MQERQIINEETSTLEVSEKPRRLAKKSYMECDLLSKKSLERVSPQEKEEEVITYVIYPNNIYHLILWRMYESVLSMTFLKISFQYNKLKYRV